MSVLPLDGAGYPIPTLGYVDGGARTVSIAATSNRTSTAFTATTDIISVCPTVDCFIRLGSNTVTAASTDHFLPANLYQDIAITPTTKDRYIAVIRAGTVDGTLYISERE